MTTKRAKPAKESETRERVLWRGWAAVWNGRIHVNALSKTKRDLFLTYDETAVRVRLVLEEK